MPFLVLFCTKQFVIPGAQHMNSSAFQLLMNTRTVSVAILAAATMLNKRMHALEWTSIVLLMVGAMQYQLSRRATTAKDRNDGVVAWRSSSRRRGR